MLRCAELINTRAPVAEWLGARLQNENNVGSNPTEVLYEIYV